MPVSPAGDDLIHSEEVSGAQHGPRFRGSCSPSRTSHSCWGSSPGQAASASAQEPDAGAHFHADALVNLVTAQGVQLPPPGPQHRDGPRLGRAQQLGPLPLQPRPAGLEQEPGDAAAGGLQRQEARGQAKQELWALGRPRHRRQVIQGQAAELLPAGSPHADVAWEKGRVRRPQRSRVRPDGWEQRHSRCPDCIHRGGPPAGAVPT